MSPALRVALIAHSNSPWAAPYARHLQERGHEVLVISFHPRRIDGVRVEVVAEAPEDGVPPKFLYLLRVPRVRRLLARFEPDVVLATYLRSNGLIGALTKRSALVVSSRGDDHRWGLPGRLDARLARWIGGRAELVHASSPELFESLVSAGIDSSRIEVFPLGIDVSRFEPRKGPRPPGPPRILCTRKHFPVYDNDTLVRAAAILRREGFPFEWQFAGTGPTLEATRRLAAELGVSSCVTFLGDLEPEQIPDLLRLADLYVSATLSDGSPSSLFEAMSCGVYPVVSDIRANRDWIVPGETGVLCRTGAAEEWAAALRAAWEDPARRERAAAINRSLVERRCGRADGLAKIEDLLRRAVDLYRGRGEAARAQIRTR